MFNNNKQLSWYQEGALTMMTGMLYGVNSVVIGHPFDTVKTKMQAQSSHMATSNQNPKYIETVTKILKNDGFLSLYKGWQPPMAGSVLFRSLQFSVYQMVYTKCDKNETFSKEIPYTNGIQGRVVLGGLISGTVRAIIECPFEYTKVKM